MTRTDLAMLLPAWLAGRSLARGLPPPVADRGGWRVDTGTAEETARWVFAEVVPGLAALGRERAAPGFALKLCGPADRLRAALPIEWQLQTPAWFMTATAAPWRAAALPNGYTGESARAGAVGTVRVRAPDGAIAAGGHAAETERAFVYDRIVTAPAYRRRGLGRAVMTALRRMRKASAAPELLIATADGRALYASLGWEVLSPYSTAQLLASGRPPDLAAGAPPPISCR